MYGAWNISVNKTQLKNKHRQMDHIYLKTIFALVIKEPKDNRNSNLDYR